ncbi:hypothetical protein C8J56DRAFT_886850 [Mycena floridula]|nr:hypothetical protein C8J56DRAFT_886850 [Mycena floridula]
MVRFRLEWKFMKITGNLGQQVEKDVALFASVLHDVQELSKEVDALEREMEREFAGGPEAKACINLFHRTSDLDKDLMNAMTYYSHGLDNLRTVQNIAQDRVRLISTLDSLALPLWFQLGHIPLVVKVLTTGGQVVTELSGISLLIQDNEVVELVFTALQAVEQYEFQKMWNQGLAKGVDSHCDNLPLALEQLKQKGIHQALRKRLEKTMVQFLGKFKWEIDAT